MLTVIGSLLPDGHILPKSMYESQKLLRALKMQYDQIHVCPKGCVLFRKEHKNVNYCLKCKSSRYLEVDSGDGQIEEAAYDPCEDPTAPPVRTEDPTAIHDRGIHEIDDMTQKEKTIQ
jgi:hypothetical protein